VGVSRHGADEPPLMKKELASFGDAHELNTRGTPTPNPSPQGGGERERRERSPHAPIIKIVSPLASSRLSSTRSP
jgi:hypothetical protein